MIKKILTRILFVFFIKSNLVILFSCNEENPPIKGKDLLFKDYDFSVDNIKEIGYAQAISKNGGTLYGNRAVYAVKKGDTRLAILAEAWNSFAEKGVFTGSKEKFTITNETISYVVIFNDDKHIRIDNIGNDKIKCFT
jgi:hypothetical protein